MTTQPSSSPTLTISRVTAVHGRGPHAHPILAPTTLDIHAGESVAVVGRSGAGKSTLADIALGLRTPAEGRVLVGGQVWCTPSGGPPRHQRRLVQGVPQDPVAAFVPRWTLRRSIDQAVRRLTGEQDTEPHVRRAAELAQLDLRLLERRPSEVSGGQAQRAAIVRAVAAGPAALVADEPTSALDSETAQAVSAALLSVTQELGIALLLVTHDPSLAERCSRTIAITAPQ
jgi:ABC-type dipeptide/oligopeptide/nickel transport system ATPase subunit